MLWISLSSSLHNIFCYYPYFNYYYNKNNYTYLEEKLVLSTNEETLNKSEIK